MTAPAASREAVDILEIAEGRDWRRATLAARGPRVVPPRSDKVMADATPGRLVTGAACIRIEGPNMRKWLAEHPTASTADSAAVPPTRERHPDRIPGGHRPARDFSVPLC